MSPSCRAASGFLTAALLACGCVRPRGEPVSAPPPDAAPALLSADAASLPGDSDPDRPAPSPTPLTADGSADRPAADGPVVGGATPGPEDADDRLARACNEYWAVVCQRYVECAPFILMKEYGGGLASCIAQGVASCGSSDSPAAQLTPEGLKACTEERRYGSCVDIVMGALPSCRLRGPKADGVPCFKNRDCQSSRCIGGEGETCGVCSTLAALGGGCAQGRDCEAGLVCKDKRCARAGLPGDPCRVDTDCRADGFCSAAGTCALSAGKVGDRCESNGCDLYHLLDCGLDGVCVPVELARPGVRCGRLAGKSVLCAVGNCPADAAATCPTVVPEGQACSNADTCAPDTTCRSGRCQKTVIPVCN